MHHEGAVSRLLRTIVTLLLAGCPRSVTSFGIRKDTATFKQRVFSLPKRQQIKINGKLAEMDGSKDSDNSKSEVFRLGYVSDVEGHWNYFLDYVRRSNVLDWEDVRSDEEVKFRQLILRPNTYFVYGGGKKTFLATNTFAETLYCLNNFHR